MVVALVTAWRGTFAVLSLVVYACLAFYGLVVFVVPWLTGWLGEPWSFKPVTA